MRISLSVLVNTISGTGHSLEQLLHLFKSYELKVTFFISTGPDRNLSFAKRIGQRGLIHKVSESLQSISTEGHDVGMGSYDPVNWERKAAHAGSDWIRSNWQRGIDCWSEAMGAMPLMHAASGYQVHPELFACEERAGLLCASDTRGQSPFYPEMQNRRGSVLQLPVTVASAEEMLRVSPGCETHLHEELYDSSLKLLPQGQHWRIIAGRDEIELVEKLIVMWRGSSKEFVTLKQLADKFSTGNEVKYHQVGWKELGREHYVAAQSLPLE